MATETKEKLIRVLQLMQTTDEKTPMNATQIVEKLSTEYELEGVNRKSIYRDIALLQDCGYDIVQTEDKRSGWYMNTHAFADWQIKIMMDAVQQARCVSINEAMQIRENLLNLTSKRGRSRFSHLIMQHSGNVNAKENIGTYIETILEAIYQHRKIEFQYTEINDDMKKVLRREGKKYRLNLYTKLKKFLHKDGYLRIAPEVYMRIVKNRKASEKHFRRIEEYAPKTGTVRLLHLTEKQYNNIYLVTGEPDYQEKIVGTNSHIML